VEANPEILREPDTLETRVVGDWPHDCLASCYCQREVKDVGMSLTSIGVDSLVSIEIRNWWAGRGMDITVLEIIMQGRLKD